MHSYTLHHHFITATRNSNMLHPIKGNLQRVQISSSSVGQQNELPITKFQATYTSTISQPKPPATGNTTEAIPLVRVYKHALPHNTTD